LSGQFDIITLIEVIEHITDPVPFLKSVAALLAPGGTLFVTTGNAEPQLKSFFKLAYVLPEIHVSYFTPRSLEILYQNVGLTPVPGGCGPGWSDIIRFKILKNLHFGTRSVIEAMLPWPLLSRLVDARYGVTAHPLAIKG
jgi:SAM-dependent methyltransferase